jgi:hypothetical protein
VVYVNAEPEMGTRYHGQSQSESAASSSRSCTKACQPFPEFLLPQVALSTRQLKSGPGATRKIRVARASPMKAGNAKTELAMNTQAIKANDVADPDSKSLHGFIA